MSWASPKRLVMEDGVTASPSQRRPGSKVLKFIEAASSPPAARRAMARDWMHEVRKGRADTVAIERADEQAREEKKQQTLNGLKAVNRSFSQGDLAAWRSSQRSPFRSPDEQPLQEGFIVSCGDQRLNGTYWIDDEQQPGTRTYRQEDGDGRLDHLHRIGTWWLSESYVCKHTSETPPLSGWKIAHVGGGQRPAPSISPTTRRAPPPQRECSPFLTAPPARADGRAGACTDALDATGGRAEIQ